MCMYQASQGKQQNGRRRGRHGRVPDTECWSRTTKKPWALVCPWLKNSSHKESKQATAEHTYPERAVVNLQSCLRACRLTSSLRGQVYHSRSLDARRNGIAETQLIVKRPDDDDSESAGPRREWLHLSSSPCFRKRSSPARIRPASRVLPHDIRQQ